MKKLYIFSLGNPESREKGKYKYTRHNAARLLCSTFNFEKYNESNKNKVDVAASEASSDEKIVFEYIVPDCYMNLSGKFILDFINYKNISPDQVVIAYDDIDISFGDIKLSLGRNSGGHNGVESVIQNLKTKDFYRIRVGIGEKPIKEMLLQDYVLSKLSEEEIKNLEGDSLKEKLEVKLKELMDLIK